MSGVEIRPGKEFKLGVPGFYAGVPEEEYHAFDAVSNSRLSKLKTSPRHCEVARTTGFRSTKSTEFGSAGHAMVLQPMEFMARYAVAEQCVAKTKGGDRCSKGGQVSVGGKWYCSTPGHAPEGKVDAVESMSRSDFDRVKAMSDEVFRHPVSRAILGHPGGFEVSMLWIHPGTGLLVKNRIDFLTLVGRYLMDYKTTADASLHAFGKSVWNFGYHRQGYLYKAGAEILGVEGLDFVFVAQEKQEPFMLMPYQLSDASIEVGRIEVEERYEDGLGEWVEMGLMYRYEECLRKGEWPGWKDDGAVFVDIPDWAYRKVFEEAV